MAEIDLVVCNYRTPDDLTRFVRSIEQGAAGIEYKLTVVDVCPTEWESNPAHGMPGSYIAFDTNVGYGRACNYGVSMGKAPIVACFNADVAFPQGSLRDIVQAMQMHPDWGIVGPRQIDSEGFITHAGIDGTNKLPKFRAWHTREDFSDTVECISVMGSAYFARRDVWEELTKCSAYQHWNFMMGMPEAIGAFLETPLYYEDMWASLHARYHGHKVMYYGGATLIHEWHKSISRHLTEEQSDAIFQRSLKMFRSCCGHHGVDCE